LEAVQRSGILPYHTVFISDHRGCYVDFDAAALFGSPTAALAPKIYRGLRLQDPRIVQKYKDTLWEQMQYHQLLKKVEMLIEVAKNKSWQKSHQQEYEKIDRLLIEIMLHAERKASKKYSLTYCWSPLLLAAVKRVQYWQLQIKQKKGIRTSLNCIKKTEDRSRYRAHRHHPYNASASDQNPGGARSLKKSSGTTYRAPRASSALTRGGKTHEEVAWKNVIPNRCQRIQRRETIKESTKRYDELYGQEAISVHSRRLMYPLNHWKLLTHHTHKDLTRKPGKDLGCQSQIQQKSHDTSMQQTNNNITKRKKHPSVKNHIYHILDTVQKRKEQNDC